MLENKLHQQLVIGERNARGSNSFKFPRDIDSNTNVTELNYKIYETQQKVKATPSANFKMIYQIS